MLHLGYKCKPLEQAVRQFLWYVIRILLKIPHVARQISRKKAPPHFILKIPNCGNVGSELPPPDSCGSAQLFPWQFGSGKLTPRVNVTTAPILSSGIHLPVTVSIYVRSPSRSLRPSDRPPLKPPPCVTVVHLPEVTPAIGFFYSLYDTPATKLLQIAIFFLGSRRQPI